MLVNSVVLRPDVSIHRFLLHWSLRPVYHRFAMPWSSSTLLCQHNMLCGHSLRSRCAVGQQEIFTDEFLLYSWLYRSKSQLPRDSDYPCWSPTSTQTLLVSLLSIIQLYIKIVELNPRWAWIQLHPKRLDCNGLPHQALRSPQALPLISMSVISPGYGLLPIEWYIKITNKMSKH